jgi:hypothetical protein
MQASGKEPSTGSSSAPITEALLGKSSSIFSAPRLVILADATISRPYNRISRIDEDRLLAQGKKSSWHEKQSIAELNASAPPVQALTFTPSGLTHCDEETHQPHPFVLQAEQVRFTHWTPEVPCPEARQTNSASKSTIVSLVKRKFHRATRGCDALPCFTNSRCP